MHSLLRRRQLVAGMSLSAALALAGGLLLAHSARANGTEVLSSDAPRTPDGGIAPSVLDTTTWIEMRNVQHRVSPTATLQVRQLRGQVMRTRAEIPFLDDPTSFAIRITSGTVALTGENLSELLNAYVFGYAGSPLKKLKVRVQGNQIVQTGVMHKGVDLPFEMTATVHLAPDGRVQIHPVKIRMLGIDGAKLLRAIGLQLDDLLDLKGAHGAIVKGNDLYLDPTALTPPPAITGRLASIRVADGMVVQEFVRLPDDTLFGRAIRPDPSIPNYVYFRGGEIRFGKLIMRDTDLTIIDGNPSDPFDLYLAQYSRQLVAGSSRTLATQALQAIMPDYHDLPAR